MHHFKSGFPHCCTSNGNTEIVNDDKALPIRVEGFLLSVI